MNQHCQNLKLWPESFKKFPNSTSCILPSLFDHHIVTVTSATFYSSHRDAVKKRGKKKGKKRGENSFFRDALSFFVNKFCTRTRRRVRVRVQNFLQKKNVHRIWTERHKHIHVHIEYHRNSDTNTERKWKKNSHTRNTPHTMCMYILHTSYCLGAFEAHCSTLNSNASVNQHDEYNNKVFL